MTTQLTLRPVLELAGKEGLVLESYLDTAKPPRWTWALGVTDASGHTVSRYKDKPSTIEHAIAVSIWLMREQYLPDVVRAFKGHKLTENELAAALSFHYNTGAILKTSWVGMFLAGDSRGARKFLETHYLNDGDLKSRRMDEAALFFSGVWAPDLGKVTIFDVCKPSYHPCRGKRMDITAQVTAALAAG